MSTASSTVGRSRVVGTLPVWPPPSPPWIITASAPQPATFSACRAAPTLGITTMPWSLSLAISSCFGASANDATLTACLMSRSTRSGASAASARKFTPKGWSVRPLTARMARSSSSCDMVALARMPRPPALAVPETSRGPATQPMPVCTTGCRTPASSVSGVLISCSIIRGPRANVSEASGFVGWWWSLRDLLVPQALRVEHLADQDELLHPGRAGLRDVVTDLDLAATCLTDLVDRHAGMHREQPERPAGPADVEDREVRHDAMDVVEPARRRPRFLGPARADAGDDVHLLDERAGAVLGHPVARAVVDGVAGGATGTQELALRLGEVTDRGDVLVAVPVDLRGAHHHVPLAVRDDVEHAAEGDPALDHVGLLTQRRDPAQEEGLAVGDQQVGVRGQLAQPCAQCGKQAH